MDGAKTWHMRGNFAADYVYSSSFWLCYLTVNEFYLFIFVFFMCALFQSKDKIILFKIF